MQFIHSCLDRESQQHERTSRARRTYKLACYKDSFQNYGIQGHVKWIFNSINDKNLQRLATQSSPTALNKGSQRLVYSTIRLSTSEHSNLKVGHSTGMFTNSPSLKFTIFYSFTKFILGFENIFCRNKKKVLHT